MSITAGPMRPVANLEIPALVAKLSVAVFSPMPYPRGWIDTAICNSDAARRRRRPVSLEMPANYLGVFALHRKHAASAAAKLADDA